MKRVVIHSDGACHGNPGPGGWAAILSYGRHNLELSGSELATTNNRMELRAAIEAFTALKESCDVDFFTDSEYVKNGVTTWLPVWKTNGWRTKAKKAVKNDDLWRALDSATTQHKVRWCWLKGHSGHEANERCDELANEAIVKIKGSHPLRNLPTGVVPAESDSNGDSKVAQSTPTLRPKLSFDSALPRATLNIEDKKRSNLFAWRGQFSPN